MRVLSLGWGVQSFTLAATSAPAVIADAGVSALGELPPIDAAVHADTTHERSATYAFARKWTGWLEDHDIRVATVQPTRTFALERVKVASVNIPAFTLSRSAKGGQLRRQCRSDGRHLHLR